MANIWYEESEWHWLGRGMANLSIYLTFKFEHRHISNKEAWIREAAKKEIFFKLEKNVATLLEEGGGGGWEGLSGGSLKQRTFLRLPLPVSVLFHVLVETTGLWLHARLTSNVFQCPDPQGSAKIVYFKPKGTSNRYIWNTYQLFANIYFTGPLGL